MFHLCKSDNIFRHYLSNQLNLFIYLKALYQVGARPLDCRRLTNEVNDIPSPFKNILTNLLTCKPKDLKNETIPAKSWIESTKRPLLTTLVPYVGSLWLEERAQIANWFDIHITHKDKKFRLSWLGYLTLSHAYTLYIAHHLKSNPKMADIEWKELLLQAWEVQFTGTPERLTDVNVERVAGTTGRGNVWGVFSSWEGRKLPVGIGCWTPWQLESVCWFTSRMESRRLCWRRGRAWGTSFSPNFIFIILRHSAWTRFYTLRSTGRGSWEKRKTTTMTTTNCTSQKELAPVNVSISRNYIHFSLLPSPPVFLLLHYL